MSCLVFAPPDTACAQLPSDLALIQDPAFAAWVRAYSQDEELFLRDFGRAWTKLMELGVDFEPKPIFKKLFG